MVRKLSLVNVSILATRSRRRIQTLEAADIFYKNVLREFQTKSTQLSSSNDKVRYHVLRTAQPLMRQIPCLLCTARSFLLQQVQELGIHASDYQVGILT
jgi:predicted house-cleaning NTP pyrophosphatase (Maf/HAM1 superfamily)